MAHTMACWSAGCLCIRSLVRHYGEYKGSFEKMRFKISSGKGLPICVSFNVFKLWCLDFRYGYICWITSVVMVTRSNGNIFRLTGLLWGELWHGASIFSLICTWTNGWTNNRDASDLKHHPTHNDVIVMIIILIWDIMLQHSISPR